MHGAIITFQGCEEAANNELFQLIKKKGTVTDTVVLFEYKHEEELQKLAYLGRSFKRVLQLFTTFTVTTNYIDTKLVIEEKIKALDESLFISALGKKTFKVQCKRIGEHDFNSVDIASLTTAILAKKIKNKIVMKNPEALVYIYIFNNDLYVGFDIIGKNLSKRDYKLFNDSHALNAGVAYTLLTIAEIKEGDSILDPLCGTGTILIEAGLKLTKKSPHFFKKEQFSKYVEKLDEDFPTTSKIAGFDSTLYSVKSTRRNAQIAGLSKILELSKVDLEWLDTKLEEKSINKIITKLPSPSKNLDEKRVLKLYVEFFHQAEFILADNGIIVVCLLKTDFFKENLKHFKLIKEYQIMQGKEKLHILKLVKL